MGRSITKSKPTPKPTLIFNNCSYVCAYHCVHCHREHSTEQFWQSFLLSSRQSSLNRCCLLEWREIQRWQNCTGQHPLTGRCAANFRVLANQWAESRLVTQWRNGCRAIRQSVCNAGASNAGRSLCVQISRERSYPQPIYWYQSKGNWLRYNSAAESFYIMKLFSRLFVLYCWNRPKDDKFRYFIPILRKLGVA